MSINFVFDDSELDSEFTLGQKKVLRRLLEKLAAAVPSTLNDLTDVDVTAPDVDDSIVYDGDFWIPLPPTGGATVGDYNPTLVDEVNAGASTVIEPWHYVQVGSMVICACSLNFDSNASSGDYLGELGFNFPVPTDNPFSLAGSLSAVNTTEGVTLAARVFYGTGSQSAQNSPLIQTYFPVNVGQANFYGVFMYSTGVSGGGG